MALPSNVSFGTVVGRFMRAVADGPDTGRDPDGIPFAGLTVKFIPSADRFKNATATPPVMIVADPITATTDADGYLIDPEGEQGIRLLATDDEDLNPTGWTWGVAISGTGFRTVSFNFALPSDGTIDLATVVPVPGNPGQAMQDWLAAVAASEAAATSAGESAGVAVAAAVDAVAAKDAAEAVPAQVDTAMAANVGTGGEFDTKLSATIVQEVEARAGDMGTIDRWRRRLAANPMTAKMVLLGDSTSSEPHNTTLYSNLRTNLTQPGMPLAGMQAVNIIGGGNSGASLAAWLSDAAGANTLPYSWADLQADAPDLVVISWGINDVRLGVTTLTQLIDRHETLLTMIRDELPGADVLIRMPPTLTTTVVGEDYVDGITHQAASTILREACLAFQGNRKHVEVLDLQAELFGLISTPTSPYKTDELHLSSTGMVASAFALGSRAGIMSGLTVSRGRFRYRGRVSGAGNGYIDLSRISGLDDQPLARELPLTTSDTLVLSQYGALSLTGFTFAASADNLRILKAGDWSALAGQVFEVDTARPGPGAQEGRYFATINPGEIAAGAHLDVTHTISGITREMGVVCQPPSSLLGHGVVWSACISANDTITVRLYNPTASAIDPAGDSGWRFWIMR